MGSLEPVFQHARVQIRQRLLNSMSMLRTISRTQPYLRSKRWDIRSVAIGGIAESWLQAICVVSGIECAHAQVVLEALPCSESPP
ncbi:hypothetical protein RJ55_06754 [Drechmeria coniospora]|nr:hypothetical protein RJ55_06754 [Drechmeria coniospora]